MPSVSGNVGAVFNGGTITGALTDDGTGKVTDPIVAIGQDGTATFSYTGATPSRLKVGFNGDGGMDLQATDNQRQVFIFEGVDPFYAQVANGTEAIYVRGDTFTEIRPVIIQTAAPADAALSAGQLAMWYDDTNGAGKLMFKAKQADGTVKTGSVAVNT